MDEDSKDLRPLVGEVKIQNVKGKLGVVPPGMRRPRYKVAAILSGGVARAKQAV